MNKGRTFEQMFLFGVICNFKLMVFDNYREVSINLIKISLTCNEYRQNFDFELIFFFGKVTDIELHQSMVLEKRGMRMTNRDIL